MQNMSWTVHAFIQLSKNHIEPSNAVVMQTYYEHNGLEMRVENILENHYYICHLMHYKLWRDVKQEWWSNFEY